jgi:hypothetical protein
MCDSLNALEQINPALYGPSLTVSGTQRLRPRLEAEEARESFD